MRYVMVKPTELNRLGEVPVATYVPTDLARVIDEHAAAAGLSRSSFVRQVLMRFFQKDAA